MSALHDLISADASLRLRLVSYWIIYGYVLKGMVLLIVNIVATFVLALSRYHRYPQEVNSICGESISIYVVESAIWVLFAFAGCAGGLDS